MSFVYTNDVNFVQKFTSLSIEEKEYYEINSLLIYFIFSLIRLYS